MRREPHVRFCEGGGVKFPSATRPLRGSFDHINDRKAAQTLTDFASASAIVLAHTEIDDKSNEIPAAQQMIRELGLSGVMFTADAMHCQKNV